LGAGKALFGAGDNHKAELEEMRRQETLNEEQRRRHADELAAHNAARERYLNEQNRKLEEKLKKSDELSNEQRKQLTAKLEENKSELEEVRKQHEEKEEALVEKILVAKDQTIELGKSHAKEMATLNEKHNENTMKMTDKIIEANRETNVARMEVVKCTTATVGTRYNMRRNRGIEKGIF
ncbi:hypothetical protein PMAYCL1PPCAC_19601, partial [Pristionchus mayeri]